MSRLNFNSSALPKAINTSQALVHGASSAHGARIRGNEFCMAVSSDVGGNLKAGQQAACFATKSLIELMVSKKYKSSLSLAIPKP